MRASVLLAVLSAALLGFAPAPFPKSERRRSEDPTDVAGTWAFVLWERRGEREEVSENRFLARITRERFDLINKDGDEPEESFVMQLEPACSPVAFKWTRKDGRISFVGSCRLHKDEMKMVFIRGDRLADRPTDFLGDVEFRFVLRRVGR